MIQIDDAAAHIGRRTSVDLGVVGDARETLRLVLPQVAPRDDRGFLDKVLSKHESWTQRQQRLVDPGYDRTRLGKTQRLVDNRAHLIRPEAVASVVNELAADDAIFTTDTGMSTVWLARFVQFREGQRLLGSFNLGSMANGDLTMLLGDLLTLVANRLPVKLVVFGNHRLGMVELEVEQAGLPEFETALDNPDLAAVATLLGLVGIRIEHSDDLRTGLTRAFATDGPVLVDVVTNPDEIAVPPHPSAGDAWGFAIAKIKETHTKPGCLARPK